MWRIFISLGWLRVAAFRDAPFGLMAATGDGCWLRVVGRQLLASRAESRYLVVSLFEAIAMSEDHTHDHSHDHDHDHSHLNETAIRVRALETLLTEKGYIDPAALDVFIDTYEHKVGPRNGAQVVARAWADADYRQRLSDDASAAIAEFGFTGRQGEHMVAVFNTPAVHNMVVCTLCSCYPWPVLGLPPAWYKSAPYRSRVVVDPRGVLREFGVELPESVEVKVWDSTAEVRYLVVPQQPEGTQDWSEEQLVELVNRNSMIGTALATVAGELA